MNRRDTMHAQMTAAVLKAIDKALEKEPIVSNEKPERAWGINIAELVESDKGQWVEYANDRGVERGRIKGWNDQWIFVVYHCDNDWYDYEQYTAAATNPNALRRIESKEPRNEPPTEDKGTAGPPPRTTKALPTDG